MHHDMCAPQLYNELIFFLVKNCDPVFSKEQLPVSLPLFLILKVTFCCLPYWTCPFYVVHRNRIIYYVVFYTWLLYRNMMLARFIYSVTGFPSGGVLTYTLNLLNFYPLQTRVLKPNFLV